MTNSYPSMILYIIAKPLLETLFQTAIFNYSKTKHFYYSYFGNIGNEWLNGVAKCAIPRDEGWNGSIAMFGGEKAPRPGLTSSLSLTSTSSCFFMLRLSLARLFWNQIFT